jgi:hypothetical protein
MEAVVLQEYERLLPRLTAVESTDEKSHAAR